MLSKAATTLSFLFAVLLLLSLPGAGSEGNFANYKRGETNTGVSLTAMSDIAKPAAAGFSYSRWLASGQPAAHENHTSGTFILKTAAGDIYRSRLTAAWRDVGARALNIEPLLRDELLLLANNKDSHWQSAWKNHREALLPALVDGTSDALLGGVLESGRALSWVRHLEVDFRTKLGKRPGSFGVNARLALHERADDATGLQLRGFFGNKFKGANAGVFYRRALGDNLLGGNVFLDYENADVGGDFWRWSLGAEWRSPYVELYGNRYLGITGGKRQLVGGQYIYTADGTEVELVLKAPYASWLSGVLSYYRWDGEYGDKVDKGFRYGIRADRRLGGFSFELQYEDPEVGKGSWGGRVSYSHDFAKGVESASSTQALTFDPRAHFFDAVRREYTQRIRRSAVLSGGVLVGYLESGATAVVRGDALTLSLISRDGVSLVANLIQGGVTLLDTVAHSAGYRFNAASPLTVSTAPAGATISISSGKWSINLKSELIFSQDSSTVQLLTGTLGIVYNAGGLIQVSLAGGPTLHLLSAILTVGNGAPLSTNLQFGGGDGSLVLNADYTLSVQVNGGRLTVYLDVSSSITYTPGAGELILIYLGGTTIRIGDLIANIANAAALVSTRYTGIVGSLSVSGREGNQYTYTLVAGDGTFAVEADGVLNLTAVLDNAVTLTLSVQVGDGGGGDSLPVTVGYTLRVADALVFLPAAAFQVTTYDTGAIATIKALGTVGTPAYTLVDIIPASLALNIKVHSDSGIVSIQQGLPSPVTLSLIIRATETFGDIYIRRAILTLTVIAVDPPLLAAAFDNNAPVVLIGYKGLVATVSVSGGDGDYAYGLSSGLSDFSIGTTDGKLSLATAQSAPITLTAVVTVNDGHRKTPAQTLSLTLGVQEGLLVSVVNGTATVFTGYTGLIGSVSVRGGDGDYVYTLTAGEDNFTVGTDGKLSLTSSLANATTLTVGIKVDDRSDETTPVTASHTLAIIIPSALTGSIVASVFVLTGYTGIIGTVSGAGGDGDYTYNLPSGLSDSARFRIGTDGQLILLREYDDDTLLTVSIVINDGHDTTPFTTNHTLRIAEQLRFGATTAFQVTTYDTGAIATIRALGTVGTPAYTRVGIIPASLAPNISVHSDSGIVSIQQGLPSPVTLSLIIRATETFGGIDREATQTLTVIAVDLLEAAFDNNAPVVLTGYTGSVAAVSVSGGDGDYAYGLLDGISDNANFSIGTDGELSLATAQSAPITLTAVVTVNDGHRKTPAQTLSLTLGVQEGLLVSVVNGTATVFTGYTGLIGSVSVRGGDGDYVYTLTAGEDNFTVGTDGKLSLTSSLANATTLTVGIKVDDRSDETTPVTASHTLAIIIPSALTGSIVASVFVLTGYIGFIGSVSAQGGDGDYVYTLAAGKGNFTVGTDGKFSLNTSSANATLLTVSIVINDGHDTTPFTTNHTLRIAEQLRFGATTAFQVTTYDTGAIATIRALGTVGTPAYTLVDIIPASLFLHINVHSDSGIVSIQQGLPSPVTLSLVIRATETFGGIDREATQTLTVIAVDLLSAAFDNNAPVVLTGYTGSVAAVSVSGGDGDYVYGLLDGISSNANFSIGTDGELSLATAQSVSITLTAVVTVNDGHRKTPAQTLSLTLGVQEGLLASVNGTATVFTGYTGFIGSVSVRGGDGDYVYTLTAGEDNFTVRTDGRLILTSSLANATTLTVGIKVDDRSDETTAVTASHTLAIIIPSALKGSIVGASVFVLTGYIGFIGSVSAQGGDGDYVYTLAAGKGNFTVGTDGKFSLNTSSANATLLTVSIVINDGHDTTPFTTNHTLRIAEQLRFGATTAFQVTTYDTGAIATIRALGTVGTPAYTRVGIIPASLAPNISVHSDSGIVSIQQGLPSPVTLSLIIRATETFGGIDREATQTLTVIAVDLLEAAFDNNAPVVLTGYTGSVAAVSVSGGDGDYAYGLLDGISDNANFSIGTDGELSLATAQSAPITLTAVVTVNDGHRKTPAQTLSLTLGVQEGLLVSVVNGTATVFTGYTGLIGSVSVRGGDGDYVYTLTAGEDNFTVGTDGKLSLTSSLANATTLTVGIKVDDRSDETTPVTASHTLAIIIPSALTGSIVASVFVLTGYIGFIGTVSVAGGDGDYVYTLAAGKGNFTVGTDGKFSLNTSSANATLLTVSIVINDGHADTTPFTTNHTLRIAEQLRFGATTAFQVTTYDTGAIATIRALGTVGTPAYTRVGIIPASLAPNISVHSDSGIVSIQQGLPSPVTLSLIIRATETFGGIDREATQTLTVIAVDLLEAAFDNNAPVVLTGYTGSVAAVSVSGGDGDYAYGLLDGISDNANFSIGTDGELSLATAQSAPITLTAVVTVNDGHRKTPAQTLSLTLGVQEGLLVSVVNGTATVFTGYTGLIGSVSVRGGDGDYVYTLTAGEDNFTVGTDGKLSLTSSLANATTLTVGIKVDDRSDETTPVTASHTLAIIIPSALTGSIVASVFVLTGYIGFIGTVSVAGGDGDYVYTLAAGKGNFTVGTDGKFSLNTSSANATLLTVSIVINDGHDTTPFTTNHTLRIAEQLRFGATTAFQVTTYDTGAIATIRALGTVGTPAYTRVGIIPASLAPNISVHSDSGIVSIQQGLPSPVTLSLIIRATETFGGIDREATQTLTVIAVDLLEAAFDNNAPVVLTGYTGSVAAVSVSGGDGDYAYGLLDGISDNANFSIGTDGELSLATAQSAPITLTAVVTVNDGHRKTPAQTLSLTLGVQEGLLVSVVNGTATVFTGYTGLIGSVSVRGGDGDYVYTLTAGEDNFTVGTDGKLSLTSSLANATTLTVGIKVDDRSDETTPVTASHTLAIIIPSALTGSIVASVFVLTGYIGFIGTVSVAGGDGDYVYTLAAGKGNFTVGTDGKFSLNTSSANATLLTVSIVINDGHDTTPFTTNHTLRIAEQLRFGATTAFQVTTYDTGAIATIRALGTVGTPAYTRVGIIPASLAPNISVHSDSGIVSIQQGLPSPVTLSLIIRATETFGGIDREATQTLTVIAVDLLEAAFDNNAPVVLTGYTGSVAAVSVSGGDGDYAYGLLDGISDNANFSIGTDGELSLATAQSAPITLTAVVTVNDGHRKTPAQTLSLTLGVQEGLLVSVVNGTATVFTGYTGLIGSVSVRGGDGDYVYTLTAGEDNFTVGTDGKLSLTSSLANATTLTVGIKVDDRSDETTPVTASHTLAIIIPSALTGSIVASVFVLTGYIGFIGTVSVAGGDGDYVYTLAAGKGNFTVGTDGKFSLNTSSANATLLTVSIVINDGHDTTPFTTNHTLRIAEQLRFGATTAFQVTTYDTGAIATIRALGTVGTPAYTLVSIIPDSLASNISVHSDSGIVSIQQGLPSPVTLSLIIRATETFGGIDREATQTLTVIAVDLLEAAFDNNAPVVLTGYTGSVAAVSVSGGDGDYAYGLLDGISDNANFSIGTDGELSLATAQSAPITLTAVVTVNDGHRKTPAQTLSLTLGVQEGLLVSVVNGTATVFTGYTGLIGSVSVRGGDGDYVYTLTAGEDNFTVGTDGKLSLTSSLANATTLTVGIKVDDRSDETTAVTASHTLAIIIPSALTGSIVASVFVLTGYIGFIGTVSVAGGDGDYVYTLAAGKGNFTVGTDGKFSLNTSSANATLLTVSIVINDGHDTTPFTTNHTLRIAEQLRFGATTAFQVTTYDTGAIATIRALGTVGTPAYTRVGIIPASLAPNISVHSDSGIVSIQQGLPSPVTLSLIIRATETFGGIDREATQTLTVIAVDLLEAAFDNNAPVVLTGYTGSVAAVSVSGGDGDYAYGLLDGISDNANFSIGTDGELSLATAQSAPITLTAVVTVNDGHRKTPAQTLSLTLGVQEGLLVSVVNGTATVFTGYTGLIGSVSVRGGDGDYVYTLTAGEDNFTVGTDGKLSLTSSLANATTLTVGIKVDDRSDETTPVTASHTLAIIIPSALTGSIVASVFVLTGYIGFIGTVSVAGGDGDYVYTLAAGKGNFTVGTDGKFSLNTSSANATLLTVSIVINDGHDTTPFTTNHTLRIAEQLRFGATTAFQVTTYDTGAIATIRALGTVGTPAYTRVGIIPASLAPNISVHSDSGIVSIQQGLPSPVTLSLIIRATETFGGIDREATQTLTVIAVDLLEAAFDNNAPVVLTGYTGSVAAVSVSGGDGDYAYGLLDGISDNANFSIGTDGELSLATAQSAPITLTAVVTVNDGHRKTPAQTLSLTLGVQEGLLVSVVNGTATVFTGYTGLIGSVSVRGGDGDYVYTLTAGEDNFTVGTDGKLSLTSSLANATTLTVGIKVDDRSDETTPVTASHTLAIIIPSALTGSIVASVFVLTGYIGFIGTVSVAGGDGDYVYTLAAGKGNFTVGTDGKFSLNTSSANATLLTVSIVINDGHADTTPFTTNHTLRIAEQLRFGATTAFQVTTYDTGAIATIRALGTVGTPAYTLVDIIPASLFLHINVHSDSGIVSIQQGLPSPVTLSLVIRATETFGGIDREATQTLTVIAVDLLSAAFDNNAPVVLTGYTGSVAAVSVSGGDGDYVYGLLDGISSNANFSIGTDGELSLATAQSVSITLTAVVTVNDGHRKTPAQTLSLTLGVQEGLLASVNGTATVFTGYTGFIGSVSVRGGDGDYVYTLTAGEDNFTVRTDGRLILTSSLANATTLTVGIKVDDRSDETTAVTASHTLAIIIPSALKGSIVGASVFVLTGYIGFIGSVSAQGGDGDYVYTLAAGKGNFTVGTDGKFSLNTSSANATLLTVSIVINDGHADTTPFTTNHTLRIAEQLRFGATTAFQVTTYDTGAIATIRALGTVGTPAYTLVDIIPASLFLHINVHSDSGIVSIQQGLPSPVTLSLVIRATETFGGIDREATQTLTVIAVDLLSAAFDNNAPVVLTGYTGSVAAVSVSGGDGDYVYGLLDGISDNANFSIGTDGELSLVTAQSVSITLTAVVTVNDGHRKTPAQTLSLTLGVQEGLLVSVVNGTATVFTGYTGLIGSVSVRGGDGDYVYTLTAGEDNFTVGTDGLLSLNTSSADATTLTVGIKVDDRSAETTPVTASHTLAIISPSALKGSIVGASVFVLTGYIGFIGSVSAQGGDGDYVYTLAAGKGNFTVGTDGKFSLNTSSANATLLTVSIVINDGPANTTPFTTNHTLRIAEQLRFGATTAFQVTTYDTGAIATIRALGTVGTPAYTRVSIIPASLSLHISVHSDSGSGIVSIQQGLPSPVTLSLIIRATETFGGIDREATQTLTVIAVNLLSAAFDNNAPVVLTGYTGSVAAVIVSGGDGDYVYGLPSRISDNANFSIGTDGELSLVTAQSVSITLTAVVTVNDGHRKTPAQTLSLTLGVQEGLLVSVVNGTATVFTGYTGLIGSVSVRGGDGDYVYTLTAGEDNFTVGTDGLLSLNTSSADATTLTVGIKVDDRSAETTPVTASHTLAIISPSALKGSIVGASVFVLTGYIGFIGSVSAQGGDGDYVYTLAAGKGNFTVGTDGKFSLNTSSANATLLTVSIVINDGPANTTPFTTNHTLRIAEQLRFGATTAFQVTTYDTGAIATIRALGTVGTPAYTRVSIIPASLSLHISVHSDSGSGIVSIQQGLPSPVTLSLIIRATETFGGIDREATQTLTVIAVNLLSAAFDNNAPVVLTGYTGSVAAVIVSGGDGDYVYGLPSRISDNANFSIGTDGELSLVTAQSAPITLTAVVTVNDGHRKTPAQTLSLTLGVFAPFLANASVVVSLSYTGAVASIANAPLASNWNLVSGGDEFALGADGKLSLTATQNSAIALTASVQISAGETPLVTLGYTLNVGLCSFFSGCRPFVGFDGSGAGPFGNVKKVWVTLSVPLALLLIEAGADVNERHPYTNDPGDNTPRGDNTPLLAAARHGTPALVSVLLDKGADASAVVFQSDFPSSALSKSRATFRNIGVLFAAAFSNDRGKDNGDDIVFASLFLDNGAYVNQIAKNSEDVTPIDAFNFRFVSKSYSTLAIEFIRAAGGKCIAYCLTLNGVPDITLATVSFSPESVTVFKILNMTITAGSLYTVRAASGLGTSFNYQVLSVFPASLSSSFDLLSVDVNNAILSLNSDLAGQDFSVYIEATDLPSNNKATFRYVNFSSVPFLTNVSAAVLVLYKGPVASVANVPAGGKFSLVSGGNIFAVADGVINLTAKIRNDKSPDIQTKSFAIEVAIEEVDGGIVSTTLRTTLSHDLKVGPCSFFSKLRCLVFVDYSGGVGDILNAPNAVATWTGFNVSLVRAFVAAGADVNEVWSAASDDGALYNHTPLLAMARFGSLEAVSALLNAGARVNAIAAYPTVGLHKDSGVLEYVLPNTANAANIPLLVSLFVDYGVSVNFRGSVYRDNPPGPIIKSLDITPLDRFNDNRNKFNDNRFILAADIIRAVGAKCLFTCLTVNGVRDISLASVSFAPASVTMTAAATFTGNLYTVRAASGLGTRFSYRVVSVSPSSSTSNFSLLSEDVNSALLSVNSDLAAQDFSVYIEAIDLPSGDKATVRYVHVARPYLANASLLVAPAYVGAVASVAGAPSGDFRFLSGGNHFTLRADGVLSLKAAIGSVAILTASIVVDESPLPLITLGYTLNVGACSFFSGCQPFVGFDGAPAGVAESNRAAWAAISALAARALIAAGANVNEVALESSDTPLLAAVRYSSPSVVSILLNAGADVNAVGRYVDVRLSDSPSRTSVGVFGYALDYNSASNNPPLASLLIANRANVNQQEIIDFEHDGSRVSLSRTPLDLLLDKNYPFSEVLIAAGGKCFESCRSGDISLAAVSFEPPSLTVTAATAGDLYTVRAASGLGTSFNYQVLSVFPANLSSSFDLLYGDVNSARLSLNSAPGQEFSVYIEVTDVTLTGQPSGEKATLKYAFREELFFSPSLIATTEVLDSRFEFAIYRGIQNPSGAVKGLAVGSVTYSLLSTYPPNPLVSLHPHNFAVEGDRHNLFWTEGPAVQTLSIFIKAEDEDTPGNVATLTLSVAMVAPPALVVRLSGGMRNALTAYTGPVAAVITSGGGGNGGIGGGTTSFSVVFGYDNFTVGAGGTISLTAVHNMPTVLTASIVVDNFYERVDVVPTVTVGYTLSLVAKPALVSIFERVVFSYTGSVASIMNVPPSGLSVVFGEDRFTVGTDGLLSLTASITVASMLKVSIVADVFPPLTLGYTLSVGVCSFFSGCQPDVNFNGVPADIYSSSGSLAWAGDGVPAFNVPAVNKSLVSLLITAGVDVNERVIYNSVEGNYVGDITPLLAATRRGKLYVVSVLLTAGADVNAVVSVSLDTGYYTDVGVLDYVIFNDDLRNLLLLFVTNSVDLNQRTQLNNVAGETPLDRYNRYNINSNSNSNVFAPAAGITRTYGGKCLSVCLVGDITLASVSFASPSVTVSAAATFTGNLYTVQAASGLGTRFSYEVEEPVSNFSLIPVDVNSAILRVNSALGVGTYSVTIKATDNNPSGDTATLKVQVKVTRQ